MKYKVVFYTSENCYKKHWRSIHKLSDKNHKNLYDESDCSSWGKWEIGRRIDTEIKYELSSSVLIVLSYYDNISGPKLMLFPPMCTQTFFVFLGRKYF